MRIRAFSNDYKKYMIIPLVQQEKKLEQGRKTVINWSHETRKGGKGSWRREKDYPWEHF